MKKLLLYVVGALLALPAMAQDVDVTYYIQNAGFDEDLTFQADGKMKEAVSTSTSLSDRSWAYIAADSTVYARPKSSSGQSRPDGRKLEAVNGFKGRVQGWKLESNSEFPKCEWTYFGSVAYDLQEKAVPIADDGSTYLAVPARPTEFDGGDGFVYLRAGWTNSALYKQVVELPCAVYRLEYWTININPNTSSVAKDLTQITCRKEVFKDEEGTGLQAQEWTKHEFEFTPISEFTMQFGYEAANAGSGGQPIVALDGIKLYKIGEADPVQLIRSEIIELQSQCDALAAQADFAGFTGLAAIIGDYSMMDLDEALQSNDEDVLNTSLKAGQEQLAKFQEAIDKLQTINGLLSKIDNLLTTTDYPGKADLEAAQATINGYMDYDGPDVVEKILAAADEANAAIRAYYFSQEASIENPADYTILIKNPWFIKPEAEPTLDGDLYVFPNEYDEDGNQSYTPGSSNADLTSEGWYRAGAEGGDQRLNWQCGRSCWNAWNNNFTTTLSIAQDIEGLPNGYYTISADMITQSGFANGTQKVFAQSIAGKSLSTASLTSDAYEEGIPTGWETVAMTADDKALVVDGKLTIGAQGTGDGNGASGWFLVTNFKLYYLGEAPADAAKTAVENLMAEANEKAGNIVFAADKKALNDTIAAYTGSTDYISALVALNAAIAEADKSIAKYEDYVPADGTTEGKTLPTVANTLKRNGGEGYGYAEDIVAFAYDYVQTWIACDTASYVSFDATVDLLKNYLNTYAPAYNNAAEVAYDASEKGKAALEAMMNEQKVILTNVMQDRETVVAYTDALNALAALVEKQNIYDNPNATDYTAFIKNPNAEAVDGWTFVMGNGDGNGEKGGQWYDGSSTRYFDTYNSGGLKGFSAMQLVEDLPNGTYEVGVYARTPAEGAYVLYALQSDTVFVEIPLDTWYDEANDTTIIASDQHGPIWEAAKAAVDAGTASDLEFDIYNANSGNGRGWKHLLMENIVVNDHQLLIGTMSGTEESQTPKVFGGAWYSVGGWTLKLVSMGDNSGWVGPIENSIRLATVSEAPADGIYTLTGVKTGSMQRGLNIIVTNGKARKVFVK